MQSNYNAPQPANLMLSELGIDPNNNNTTFDPKNQPKQIGKQFHKSNRNINKYAENNFRQQYNDQDKQIPNNLALYSKVQKKQEPELQQKKGRRKQGKKNQKKNQNKGKKQQQNKKQQIKIDIDMNQVKQWQYKGTNANNKDSDEESFDQEEKQQENNDQKQAIKRRLEEKLKKYQNSGSSAPQPKNTTNSLKNKALQLKGKNQQGQKQTKEISQKQQKTEIQNQSTHQLMNKKNPKNEEKVLQKNEEEQQSEDPWEKVNKKTMAQKQKNEQAIKNAENIDLNKYYENLSLLDDEQQSQTQPQTGFFQTLCACLKTKKKSMGSVQKQLIKISKIQLTNKAQQLQLLKQIWTKLTSKKFLRYGQHWNDIGFQGRDPSTDLRSTGVLSLLQWNNFLNFDIVYAQKFLNNCIQFDIPAALTHIKITSLVCSSIRKRLLDGKKWDDFQQWYNAFVYYTCQHIMQSGKSQQQIGELVEKSIQRTKNNIQNAKKYYNNQIKSKR